MGALVTGLSSLRMASSVSSFSSNVPAAVSVAMATGASVGLKPVIWIWRFAGPSARAGKV